jgi:hypothetical protein
VQVVFAIALTSSQYWLHHILVLAITERVMPDTEPANDLDVADILKVAGISVLYALVTLASLFFLVWLIKMIWNIG